MCTLTFIPKKFGFILTSSRDERVNRLTIAPETYKIDGHDLIFPKDAEKGGSWLVLGEKMAVCLLNGSFSKFLLKRKYKESRGKIVLKRFDYKDNQAFLETENLKELPPFTMVIVCFENEVTLTELSWNGQAKCLKKLNPIEPKIWSSSTLYSEEQRNLRTIWFNQFLQTENYTLEQEILNFHQKEHSYDAAQNILMKREDGIQTTSISQIIKAKNKCSFYYKNTLNNKTTAILWNEKETDL